jgi:aldose 1-epimerase
MRADMDVSEENIGRGIKQITLSNGQLTIVVHNFGARLHKLFVPERGGKLENVLLSKENPETYATDKGYYGLICGPVAGRIAGAAYNTVKLIANEGKNLLHSGEKGWARQFWDYEIVENGIRLSLTDVMSGFPTVAATVRYELIENSLRLTLTGKAISADNVVFNPAWHPYFNLSADRENTLGHIIQTSADRLVEVDDENIPTGRLLAVDHTVYDLRSPVSLGNISAQQPSGFDNCFVFPDGLTEKQLSLYEPQSGRQLTCQTDRQAVVIYTASNPETESIINGRPMFANRGIAIEFQEIPDSVHQPEWGGIALETGEEKNFTTTYTFSVD